MDKTKIPILTISIWFLLSTCIFAEQEFHERLEESLPSLLTEFSLLIGFPDSDESSSNGVLIVPGVVIPISVEGTMSQEKISAYLHDYNLVIDEISGKIQQALRLKKVETYYHITKNMLLNDKKELKPPYPDSTIKITLTLLGFSETLASYQVTFRDEEKTIVDTSISIPRGQRSVVGGLDGEQAPYFFLVIEPLDISPDELLGDPEVVAPEIIKKSTPIYPEECKSEKLTGRVVLEVIITEQGNVSAVSIINSPDGRLSEAATNAVTQWKFKPARLNNEPIQVAYVLTFSFNLH